MGHKESIADTAQVLGRMFDAIEYRGSGQENVEELARFAGVPVYNGLTNEWHPTQMLADFLTMQERLRRPVRRDRLRVRRGRPLQHGSLAARHRRDPGLRRPARDSARAAAARRRRRAWPTSSRPDSGARITITDDVEAGVEGVDFVHTDVWVSMGEPKEVWAERAELLEPYQVNAAAARGHREPEREVHALPARVPRRSDDRVGARDRRKQRECPSGLEVTDEVFRSPASIVFDQAENRLHTIKAVLVATLA